MIQRQHLQRSIFEAAIGSIEKLIDGLIEPALQRLDEVLTDEQLLEAVLGRLAQRWLEESAGAPQAHVRPGPGTRLQEGGLAISDLLAEVPEAQWEKLVREVFLG